jgi:hypothetical protein
MRHGRFVSARDDFDRTMTGLAGIRIEDIAYWDIHNFSDLPREWDFGDWHHAVMGVELKTSAGPVSVLWTNTFFPYGVEVFREPITDFLNVRDEGPERWTVTGSSEWGSRVGQPILSVETHWETLEIGPAPDSTERTAAPAETVELPVALRLDFPAGPVWFVVGVPTDGGGVFIPGDEIMVVFTSEAMLRLGFPTGSFIGMATA